MCPLGRSSIVMINDFADFVHLFLFIVFQLKNLAVYFCFPCVLSSQLWFGCFENEATLATS